MVSLRRIAVRSGVLAGAVLALIVFACAALLAINWRDRPPSEETIRLTREFENRARVADESNAYLFLLGFGGSPDADPMTLGIARRNWMRTTPAGDEFDRSGDPLLDDYDFRSGRSRDVTELSRACMEADDNCLRALETGGATIEEWLTTEGWLLGRYRSLITLEGFAAVELFDVRSIFPSYSTVFEGQRLLMAKAWVLAGDGKAESLRSLLDRDLRFWRMALANSEKLITKMIATDGVLRHFKTGNLVLRRLPPDIAHKAMPPSWKMPIDLSERSMRRSFTGEWLFADETIKSLSRNESNPLAAWRAHEDTELWSSVRWQLLGPLWQPQDTSNRHATMMIELAELFDVPYASVRHAASKAEFIQRASFKPLTRAYNLTGDLILDGNLGSIHSYAVRVADLEGVRRAALLTAELRAAGMHSSDIAASLPARDARDPYTNELFEWQHEPSAIVFTGLEPHPRGRHAVLY